MGDHNKFPIDDGHATYTGGMTVAHDHDDLHRLIDRLPPDKARRLLRLVKRDPELAVYADETPEPRGRDTDDHQTFASVGIFDSSRSLSLIGACEGGPTDLAERGEDYLREYFNNSS